MIAHYGKRIGVEALCQAARPNWKSASGLAAQAVRHFRPEQPDAAIQPWHFLRQSLNA